ncbi:MAG: restriction endonuclease subunit M, partial [Planctomycetaceae bacterium]
IAPAFQLRRYGWSAKLALSILTDFEEFAVYDCRVRPVKTDGSSTARVMYVTFDQYEERWDEIAAVFSRDAVLKGSFDRYAESKKKKRGTAEVDAAFLDEIDGWRLLLARNLALRNRDLSQRDLNFAVQKTIDRLIFLRICEDRGMETYGRLQVLPNGPNIYRRLCELFREADDRYNSGLFHFAAEKDRRELPDEWTLGLTVDDAVLKEIIRKLYYPDSPYEFSVIGADILGQVYEQFLGKVIRLTAGHQAKVEEKPEVRKAGGVYYTPTYIVEYIVKNTVGKLLEGKTAHEVAARTPTWKPAKGGRPLSVLDPACGSGSFLIGAYQYLLDWYRDWFVADDPSRHKARVYQTKNGQWRLSTAERKRILLDHIYGVDIDSQAVEVTKLSLLLKVLEGETKETLLRQLFAKQRALPDLADNIQCGNSLIGPDFYRGKQLDLFDDEERMRINVFEWETEFSDIMLSGGFDAVIGNPPYIRVGNIDEKLRPYLYQAYDVNHRFDIYVVFIRRAFDILANSGTLAFIVPNKFFTAEYGSSLRGFLADSRTMSEIVDFGDAQVFGGATIYTCLLFLTKTSQEALRYSSAQTTRASTSFQIRHSFALPAHRLSTAPWAFVDNSAARLLDRMRQFTPLSVFCAFQRGLETGCDNVFLLTKVGDVIPGSRVLVTSHASPVPFEIEESAIRKVLKGAVDVRRYLIDNKQRYVLFPYDVTSGKPIIVDERRFKTEMPLAWSYLTRYAKQLRSRKKPGEWYSYRRRNYDLCNGVVRLLVPSIGLRASFAADSVGEYHFVGSGGGGGGGYGLSLRPSVDISFHYLLGLLNSRLLDWLVKLSNSRFGHGYYSFNRQYLEPLPILQIDKTKRADSFRQDRVTELAQQMLEDHQRLGSAKGPHEHQLLARQIATTDREIDQLVYELYGLTDDEIRIVEQATAGDAAG